MGNAQSDSGEEAAYQVIQHIPGVGLAYGAIRSAVYAGKGDTVRAEASITEGLSGSIPGMGFAMKQAEAQMAAQLSGVIKPRFSPGDILEFHYGAFFHYALYTGNGNVMDIPGLKDDHWVTILERPVEEVYNHELYTGRVRIRNLDDIAHRHFQEMKPRSVSDILDHARSYKNKKVPYEFMLRNCEYYCTLWRFGKGFSVQVARPTTTPYGGLAEGIPIVGLAVLGPHEVTTYQMYRNLQEGA